MKFAQVLLVFALFMPLTTAAVDLTPAQEAKAERVIDSVMSPFCAGRLLRDCPSGQASELKDKIRAKIAAGESEDKVLSFLLNQYGDTIRAAPEMRGFGVWAWATPFLFLFLGGGIIYAFLKTKKDAVEENAPELDAEMKARIESELNRSN